MQVFQHLRYSFRILSNNKAFTAAVVLTLALGIGANTAIFSVVDSVLLRPAPVEALERLAMVWETDRNSGTTREPASVPDYLDFAARSRSFREMAAFMAGEANMTPPSGDPVRLAALLTTHRMLPMLGIQPILGRTFTEEEDRAHGPRVALISESLWTREYGRDPSVVGRTLRLDEETYTIVGVVPGTAGFGVLQILSSAAYSRSFADRGDRMEVDVWMPLQPDPEILPRDTHPIFVLGRLASGVGLSAAQQEMGVLAADLERTHRSNDGRGTFVEPLGDVVFGPVRPPLLVLLGAVALLLLVACANISNLLLARGAGRIPEVATRVALGADRHALARQFLIESSVLTLAGALAGVAVAVVALKALLALAPADVARLSAARIDLRVLCLTLGLSALVSLVFGMVPTLQIRHLDLQSALKGAEGRHATEGRVRSRLRAALVMAELALAVVLVVAAGLLIKSFGRLLDVDPGFRAAGVLKAEYQLPPARYPVDFRVWPNFKEMHGFTEALLRRVAALPGVESAAVAGNHPLDPGFTNSFQVVGREAEAKNWPEISVRRTTPGYFRTVGLALVRGRLLRDSDSTSAPSVLLINESAARRFFPRQDPLGARIRFWGAERTIVGVVANERFHGLSGDLPLAVYIPLAQAPSANGAGVLLVRTGVNPSALASSVRAAIRETDPGLAVFGIETLDQTLSRSLSQRRFTMLLLTLFAGVALSLAAVGIHGLLSYSIAQRMREVGIRMALGAQPAEVLRLIVGEGAVLATAGIAIGLAGALALTRVLSGLLYGVTATDPATFAVVAVFLAAVSLAACLLPAMRAASVDPAAALR